MVIILDRIDSDPDRVGWNIFNSRIYIKDIFADQRGRNAVRCNRNSPAWRSASAASITLRHGAHRPLHPHFSGAMLSVRAGEYVNRY
jgi:hypothetical protein